MLILQKLIDLASFEKEEAIYTISCFDMHKRNRNTTADLEAYFFSISNSELVINELKEYQAVLKLLNKYLTDSFTGEFEEYDSNNDRYEIYEFLLDRMFSEYQLYIPNQPTDRIHNLIQHHYQKKKIYSEGLAKFFTIVKKKMIQDEDGNDVMVDWTESDELNKVASEDLSKIELLQEWDSFIDTMKKVKEMLENEEDVLEILKLIK
jgi:hypothetical protein